MIVVKKLFLLFLILILISSCVYNDTIQDSPKSPKGEVVDVSKFQDRPPEGGEKSGEGDDYGYPVNMPSYLNWGDYISGMDQFHSRSFVSPLQMQGNFGTCWAFAAVALVESHYLLTHSPTTDPINIAELGVLFGCGSSECYWINSDHPCNGGATRFALEWMSENPIPLEATDCFPYGDLTGDYGYCSCYYCDLHYWNQEDNPDSDPYRYCNYINMDFSWHHEPNPSWNYITSALWKYGPVAGSFKTGYGGSHVMLIYGYDDRSGALIVKDTADGDQYKTYLWGEDPQYIDFINTPINHYNLGCGYTEDNDNYYWWGIGSTADAENYLRPSPCSGYPEPDCFDGMNDVSQCRFSCHDDGEYDWQTQTDIYDEPAGGPGSTCEPWETCNTCFDDCYIPQDRRSTDACAGDGVCEGEEDCITSPLDCGPCPECSDRIDNDGDGYIDYQGYQLDGINKDLGCDGFEDDSEYPPQDESCSDETPFNECRSGYQPLYCVGNEDIIKNGDFWEWIGEESEGIPIFWSLSPEEISITGSHEEQVMLSTYPSTEHQEEYLYQTIENLFPGETYIIEGRAKTSFDETGEYPEYDYPWKVSIYDSSDILVEEVSGEYDFSWIDFTFTFIANSENVQIRFYPDGVSWDGMLPIPIYNYYDNISIKKAGDEFINNCQECGCPEGKTCDSQTGNCIKKSQQEQPNIRVRRSPEDSVWEMLKCILFSCQDSE
jgi:hypothetical protein